MSGRLGSLLSQALAAHTIPEAMQSNLSGANAKWYNDAMVQSIKSAANSGKVKMAGPNYGKEL